MKNALEVSHLTKDYGSFKLDDVSFTVPGGTIMGLIGENGAGKSTTIKCILNLVRRGRRGDPGAGPGQPGRTSGGSRPRWGVVLDETTFHDGLSAPQVGSILARLYPGWDGALYQHYLEKFGLTSKKLVKTFSKGMKMKLSLAAAFAARPPPADPGRGHLRPRPGGAGTKFWTSSWRSFRTRSTPFSCPATSPAIWRRWPTM